MFLFLFFEWNLVVLLQKKPPLINIYLQMFLNENKQTFYI